MRTRTALRLSTVALACSLLTAVAAPAQAVTADERSVAWRINYEHYKRRIHSLAVWETLSQTARAHSCEMARRQSLYHNPNLARSVRGWRVLGENVAVGWNLYEIHKAWMASAPHRANILDWDYDAVGVGICRDAGGSYWVTTVFFGW